MKEVKKHYKTRGFGQSTPLLKGISENGSDGKTVPLSVSGKTVPTVPVSGSSSVHEPPCYWIARCPETPQTQDARLKNETGMDLNHCFLPPLTFSVSSCEKL